MTRAPEELAARVGAVRERIAAAARRAGRDPTGIRLVGATKDVAPERIREAAAAGVTDVGENRAGEMSAKQSVLADVALRWHFIGALQRSAVRAVLGRVVLVHGIGSPAVARVLARRAEREGLVQDVLLEVNVSGEATKSGVAPEDVEDAAGEVASLAGLRLRGLMTVGPQERERIRAAFRALREARDRAARRVPGLTELSMGMSADFEAAVEEGATIVRVGRAIFGARPA